MQNTGNYYWAKLVTKIQTFVVFIQARQPQFFFEKKKKEKVSEAFKNTFQNFLCEVRLTIYDQYIFHLFMC